MNAQMSTTKDALDEFNKLQADTSYIRKRKRPLFQSTPSKQTFEFVSPQSTADKSLLSPSPRRDASQIRKTKRDEVLAKKRGRGGQGAPPHFVGLKLIPHKKQSDVKKSIQKRIDKRLKKIKEERLHVMFPDEVDTPMERTARERFTRYRGLKSFRTSPWDPKENLPLDYARIFQFANFRQTKKRVMNIESDGGALLDRFLPADTVTMATVYAPTMFPPASVLVFKETYSGEHELVATGSLHSVNPNRIVTKRTVLSGLPFKINKRSAVVRFMFFNRGTHGHMKCVFDGQLKSQDTVLMNLYKRVFPKWTYNPHVNAPPVINEFSLDTMETEEDEEEEGTAYQMFE
ncbi:TSR1 [Mytilus edulis]|uniref:Pre-rRNA-processing protein TSR1 homolog n=1 Tax=Mytilus edulis TaxID=6550 RepID=A0A8S3SSP5_MYTED|nr:TSR1 [Mytilus edulis]